MHDGDPDIATVGIILAHSESSAFVSARSKVLHNVADSSLIAHALRQAITREWNPIVIVANAHNSDQIGQVANDALPTQVKIVECHESASALDAVRRGLSCLEDATGTVAVIPADMPLLGPSDTLLSLEAMLADENTIAQVPYVGLLNRSATKHPPVFCADLQWLRHLLKFLRLSRAEQDSKEQEPWVLALRKAIGAHYCDRPEKMLIRLCTIGYAVCAAREEDLGVVRTRVDLALAERILQSRLIRKHQLAGVTFRDTQGTFLGTNVKINQDTEIGVGVQLYGNTVIGSGCRIEGPTTITNSRLEDKVYIRSFTTLEGAHVHEGSGAGPYARLREGTELGPSSYLGNFVETKNATLGKNTLACHLTYIGDAEVGSRTNIGAGTITCNFNGIAKNNTVIGDNSFIGSNSTLVAPVKIGSSTTVAAGSVVTKDVPDNAVVFGRARQETKDGYSDTLRMRLQSRQRQTS